jgi:tetratricopeptide (TPR) repeat protein
MNKTVYHSFNYLLHKQTNQHIMKKVLFLAVALFGTLLSYAQIETPRPSPMCKVEQKVGLTDVTLEFSRPSVKGRELFVDIEAFGQMWRTGANASSKISFSDDVMIEGKKVPAGTYAIYSIPGKKEWTIMLYKDLTLGGYVANYDESKELIRFTTEAEMLNKSMETFFILIDNIKSNSADIALVWGNYYVPFNMTVDTDTRVMNSIETTMAGPSADDYYAAASYFYETDKDAKQALSWIQKANANAPRYWRVRLEANLLAKLGMYDKAIATAKRSSELAREAGNARYAEGNDKLIEEWSGK